MGTEQGEESVGLFVAQEVLGGEDGGEARDDDREHDGHCREGHDAGLPGREVVWHRREWDVRIRSTSLILAVVIINLLLFFED